MAVKKTLLSFDSELLDRKKKTGKTWDQVVVKGIEAFEMEVGVVYVGDKPPEDLDPDLKKEVEKDILPQGPFEIIVSKPEDVEERIFDIFNGEMWLPVNAFSDVPEGSTFRIRDDNVVITINKWKAFSYSDLPYKSERQFKCVIVIGVTV